jgi:hypothetical protein
MFQWFYRNKTREEKIGNDIFITSIISIFKQVITTVVLTYVLGCFWYRMSFLLGEYSDQDTWIRHFGLNEMSTGEKLVASLYFILTTLSTVGYGDFYPIAIVEKIIGSIIMFCGVIYFSLLMGKFIEIVLSLKDQS